MRKKTALVAIAILAFAASYQANAADMPIKAPRYKASVPVAAYDWTGFYIGGHGGYGLFIDNHTAVTANPDFPAGFQFDEGRSDGGFGGVQVGLNYQIRQWVIGIEADYSWANIKGSTTTFSPIVAGDRTVNSTEIDWFYTVTGRLGYAWNNWLLFVKGGYVRGQITGGSTLFNAAGVALTGHSTRSIQEDGWTIGTGFEYGFWSNWSAKFEYDYFDFGTTQQTRTAKGGGVVLEEIREHTDVAHVFKIGLNYRFGFPALH